MHALTVVLVFFCALTLGMLVNTSIVALNYSVSLQTIYGDYVYRSSKIPDFEGIARVFKQSTSNTCGAAATVYLLSLVGDIVMEEKFVREIGAPPEAGYSFLNMATFLESRGFRAQSFSGQITDLPKRGEVPVIAHLERGHYLVVHAVSKTRVVVFDPATGAVRSESPKTFLADWSGKFLRISTR